jgi:pullulanase
MRNRSVFLVSFLLLFKLALGQTNLDYQRGYMLKGDSVCFLFDESIYGIQSSFFVVTGAFRGWSQDLKDPQFQLKSLGNGKWGLSLYNKNFARVKPSQPFKFRTADGKWLEPPAVSDNSEGGNLVFLKGFEPLALDATILNDSTIFATITGIPEVEKSEGKFRNLLLTNAQQEVIAIGATQVQFEASASKQLRARLTLTIPKNFDKRRVYYLSVPGLNLKELVSFNGWFKHLKSDKELGANVNEAKTQTSFRVFAPRATAVKLYLYTQAQQEKPDSILELVQDNQGVWEVIIPKDLVGMWYDYTVHGFKDPGNFFYETHPVHVSDPYARVSDDSFGKCRVAYKTIPAKPLAKGRPTMSSLMAYEVHVQDFTDLLPIPESMRGTIAGMYVPKLKNKRGKAIGFDYLTNLGINTVHLMPVQEMLHWPKDEWEKAFKNDPYMIEQGIATENYDWGYRTSHSFAIESRYRTKGTEAGEEREQFKQLVEAFHAKGIAVIVDFVFNHTAENMDGREYLFHFNAFDKQYYYRTKNLEHIGEYGNETKSEERYMVQRWIIDQCKHFIEEFGIDGFRIDLAGQTDKQTLLALKEALPKDIIIYGEPWIDSNDPNYNKNPEWHWYKSDAPICYFNDDTRNTYKGPVFELNSKEKDRGWAGGNSALRDDVKRALTCTFPTQKNINSAINYLDIHDNFALADQFATYQFDGRFGVDEINYKIAATLLFTTPGPLVLHGGSEMMRSKGMAPLMEIEKEIPSGKIYFHGKRDTYNMRNANQFVWENVGLTQINKKISDFSKAVPYTNANYDNMVKYWSALMELRKRYLLPMASFQVGDAAAKQPIDAFEFFEPKNKAALGYMIEQKVLVLLNTGEDAEELEVTLPSGIWKLEGNENAIALDAGFGKYYEQVNGGQRNIKLAPMSIQIWIRN